jgi:hypothetical protein
VLFTPSLDNISSDGPSFNDRSPAIGGAIKNL